MTSFPLQHMSEKENILILVVSVLALLGIQCFFPMVVERTLWEMGMGPAFLFLYLVSTIVLVIWLLRFKKQPRIFCVGICCLLFWEIVRRLAVISWAMMQIAPGIGIDIFHLIPETIFLPFNLFIAHSGSKIPWGMLVALIYYAFLIALLSGVHRYLNHREARPIIVFLIFLIVTLQFSGAIELRMTNPNRMGIP